MTAAGSPPRKRPRSGRRTVVVDETAGGPRGNRRGRGRRAAERGSSRGRGHGTGAGPPPPRRLRGRCRGRDCAVAEETAPSTLLRDARRSGDAAASKVARRLRGRSRGARTWSGRGRHPAERPRATLPLARQALPAYSIVAPERGSTAQSVHVASRPQGAPGSGLAGFGTLGQVLTNGDASGGLTIGTAIEIHARVFMDMSTRHAHTHECSHSPCRHAHMSVHVHAYTCLDC